MKIRHLVFVLAFTLFATAFTGLTVHAQEDDPTSNSYQDDIAELQRQLDELLRRLNNLDALPPLPPPEPPPQQPQPTPPPTFEPIPILLQPQSIVVEAGGVYEFTVTIRNIGSHTVQNLLTQASSDGPFSIEFLNNSNSVNSLAGNRDTNMTMRVTVDQNASPGSHTIALSHFFRDQSRENHTRSDDRINVRIGGTVGTPNVRAGDFQMGGGMFAGGHITPGQTFTVSATIENIGTANARDVQVRFPDLDTSKLFSTGDPNLGFFAVMEQGDSSRVNFTFQAASRIDGGMHTAIIPFSLTFRDENNENQSTEVFSFPVNIYSEEDDSLANLQIRNMQSPTGFTHVDQIGVITFEVYNAGEADARNIRVEANPESSTAIVPMGTPRTQTIPLLEPGQSQLLTFGFSPRDTAVTRSYAIGFSLFFEEGRGSDSTSHTLDQFAFAAINVYNPEEDEDDDRIQIPRIIVSSYTVYPQIPLAGQTFDMEITFQNTSATRSVNNIVITMEALEAVRDQGTVFSPAAGSNTMFIEYIPPRGEVTRTISWFTVPDASPRSYPMRVSFIYQDQDYREFSAEENLNINVQQVVRLDLSDMNFPATVTQGNSIWLDLQIINSGMVTLRNLRVRVDGPFDVSEANMFIGNVSPGAFRSYTGSIIPLESGRIEGSFVVYGEDATGATVEFENDFVIYVEADEWGDGMFMGDDTMWAEGGGMVWGDDMFGDSFRDPWGDMFGESNDGFDFIALVQRPIFIIPVVGFIVVATVVVILVVKRKRNKLEFDDEA